LWLATCAKFSADARGNARAYFVVHSLPVEQRVLSRGDVKTPAWRL